MNEKILVLDTSTPAGSVAVSCGEKLLGEIFLNASGNHTDRLLSTVDALLLDLGLSLEELDAFGVVLGPGSFTGLRVGVATVKGLALASGRPVVGISSLAAVAVQVPFARHRVCALLDARKKEVYGALFDTGGGTPRPLGAEFVLPPEKLFGQIEGELLFVGEGAAVYRNLIAESMGERARFAPWGAAHPRAGAASALVLEKLRRGETIALEKLVPVYIRPSEAEIMMAKKLIGG